MKNEWRALKIQIWTLLNMKTVVNYLNFVIYMEIKTKSKYKILNFVFQFTNNTNWHFGFMDYSLQTYFVAILAYKELSKKL